jgi:hypothetical protein
MTDRKRNIAGTRASRYGRHRAGEEPRMAVTDGPVSAGFEDDAGKVPIHDRLPIDSSEKMQVLSIIRRQEYWRITLPRLISDRNRDRERPCLNSPPAKEQTCRCDVRMFRPDHESLSFVSNKAEF